MSNFLQTSSCDGGASHRSDVLDLTTAADKCDLDAGESAAGREPLGQFERTFGARDDRNLASARRIRR